MLEVRYGKKAHLLCNAHIDPIWQWETMALIISKLAHTPPLIEVVLLAR